MKRKIFIFKLQELDSNFTHLNQRLIDEVLEPLEAYHRPFADVKVIAKSSKLHKLYSELFFLSDTPQVFKLQIKAKHLRCMGFYPDKDACCIFVKTL